MHRESLVTDFSPQLVMPNKNILIISYYFPPINNVGALRALGFARNLPDQGWTPHVLSVKNPDLSLCSLGAEGPPTDIDTTYCRSLFNLNRLTWKANGALRLLARHFGLTLQGNIVSELISLPDEFIGWVLPAYMAGRRIIKRFNIDLIYVSSKPFSTTLAGVMLKQTTGKPLVLDFRDPASFPPNLFLDNMAGRMRQKFTARLEKFVLRKADHLITTTRSTESEYRRRYPFLRNKIKTIYNGYYLPADSKPSPEPFRVFTIVYLGNFYYNLLPSDSFFQALRNILDQGLIPPDRIRFLYVGKLRKKSNWLDEAGRRFGISSILQTTGVVPREKAQHLLKRSALMLLRIVPPMISTKLFEALRDGIPMLAIIDHGEVEHLVNTFSPKSHVVTTSEVKDIITAIVQAYQDWMDGRLTHSADDKYLTNFSKPALTKELTNILNQIPKT